MLKRLGRSKQPIGAPVEATLAALVGRKGCSDALGRPSCARNGQSSNGISRRDIVLESMQFVRLSMSVVVCESQRVDRSSILVSACRSKGLSSDFARALRATSRTP